MVRQPEIYRTEEPLKKDELIMHPTNLSDVGDLIYTIAWYDAEELNVRLPYEKLRDKIISANTEADANLWNTTNMALKRMEKQPDIFAFKPTIPIEEIEFHPTNLADTEKLIHSLAYLKYKAGIHSI